MPGVKEKTNRKSKKTEYYDPEDMMEFFIYIIVAIFEAFFD
jgi:hypothetical protein